MILVLSVAWSSSEAVECPLRQVSEHIYLMVGSDHGSCPERPVEHPLTNPAAIVGDSGVILVDPGSSLQVGRLLLDRLDGLTDKPVVAVLNSHIHGLYWLGNQAVRERWPRVYLRMPASRVRSARPRGPLR